MSDLSHRTIRTNGINMHIAEQGEGPLVVLLHGFPELWYAWRHQLPALAEAGYHAVAPDVRGYGRTDAPEPIESYNMVTETADIAGLLDALGESTAVVVGQDWARISRGAVLCSTRNASPQSQRSVCRTLHAGRCHRRNS